MPGFIDSARIFIHSIRECFSAIWGCIKSLARAFWSALKILWFAYQSYKAFISTVLTGVWELLKSGSALLVSIFIPPKTHIDYIPDSNVKKLADDIRDMMKDPANGVPISELEKIESEGGYLTTAVDRETGRLIKNTDGSPLTFTNDLDDKSKAQVHKNGGAIVVGSFA